MGCLPMPHGSIKLRSGSGGSQRKLLHPNHFSSLDDLEQTIQDFIPHYNQTAKPLKWSSTVEQLEHKLATRLIRDVKSVGA